MGAFIVIIGLIVFFSWRYVSKQNKRDKRILMLKQSYNDALSETDKKDALDKGRLYYSALRKKGILTIYDEQAITNDLSSMKNNQS